MRLPKELVSDDQVKEAGLVIQQFDPVKQESERLIKEINALSIRLEECENKLVAYKTYHRYSLAAQFLQPDIRPCWLQNKGKYRYYISRVVLQVYPHLKEKIFELSKVNLTSEKISLEFVICPENQGPPSDQLILEKAQKRISKWAESVIK